MENYWGSEVYTEIFRLDSSLFPSVKWEDDEPTEAYITPAEPQEQLKQEKEIDWLQRRCEIAKILDVQYSKTDEKGATHSAYEAINELKKQSDELRHNDVR